MVKQNPREYAIITVFKTLQPIQYVRVWQTCREVDYEMRDFVGTKWSGLPQPWKRLFRSSCWHGQERKHSAQLPC